MSVLFRNIAIVVNYDPDFPYFSSIGGFDYKRKITVFDYLVLFWNFTGKLKYKTRKCFGFTSYIIKDSSSRFSIFLKSFKRIFPSKRYVFHRSSCRAIHRYHSRRLSHRQFLQDILECYNARRSSILIDYDCHMDLLKLNSFSRSLIFLFQVQNKEVGAATAI